MEIVTAIGNININEDDIITFKTGILGFEHLMPWGLVKSEEEGLSWLISLEDENIAFILWHIQEYLSDYTISGYDLDRHQSVYTILTIRNEKITANLVAPIIIDVEKHTGSQFIMTESGYSTQTLLYTREDEKC